jgi:hypothetical protein
MPCCGATRALSPCVGAFQSTSFTDNKRGGRGLLVVCGVRDHLPLRGKLGWMTPRAGVKTTPATRRALRGSRTQAGAPLFSSDLNSTPAQIPALQHRLDFRFDLRPSAILPVPPPTPRPSLNPKPSRVSARRECSSRTAPDSEQCLRSHRR